MNFIIKSNYLKLKKMDMYELNSRSFPKHSPNENGIDRFARGFLDKMLISKTKQCHCRKLFRVQLNFVWVHQPSQSNCNAHFVFNF